MNLSRTLCSVLPAAGFLLVLLLARAPSRRHGARCADHLADRVRSLARLIVVRSLGTASGPAVRHRSSLDSSPNIRYHVGLDGLSLWLVILSDAADAASRADLLEAHRQTRQGILRLPAAARVRAIGVFIALDLFLFYVFWEVSLVPMYFLIGIWGHERRIYAAVKFFLYTMAGSVLMLGAIIYLYNRAGTFDYPAILTALASGQLALTHPTSSCCCSWRSSSPSPSRCRCSRCTPGCRTRTSKRPPPVR